MYTLVPSLVEPRFLSAGHFVMTGGHSEMTAAALTMFGIHSGISSSLLPPCRPATVGWILNLTGGAALLRSPK